jgi:hypothetical protein
MPFWRWRRRAQMNTRAEPIRIAAELREVPGKWVAIKDRRVVDAAETPDALYWHLKTHGIKGATIIRSPGEYEPLQIGLG